MTDHEFEPASHADNPHVAVQNHDTSEGVRLVPKPDRRGPNRVREYDCPRCLWPDAVTVIERPGRTLRLLCSRCAWDWLVDVPRQS